MKDAIEKLWSEYFAEDCAVIQTKEERDLVKKVDERHKRVNALLAKDQNEELEAYVEALYDLQGVFVKKAFFRGCEFATSFFFKIGDYEKR